MRRERRGAAARVVVVGGGFAGLAAARALAGARAEVTLVDRTGHHLFHPLLYRVALGDLAGADVVAPIAAVLRGTDIALRVDEVRRIDAARRRVVCAGGVVPYDLLVLAAGAAPCYLGHDRWRALAPPLHTLDDAREIRWRLRRALAAALVERDAVRRAEWLTFAVVGGGPTGVELAGGVAELAAELPAGHPGRAARVVLLERAPRLLPAYPEAVARTARRLLDAAGVEVRTRAAVAGIDAAGVRLPGERIAARTVLWAAGVAGSPLAEDVGPVDPRGRAEVRLDLSVPGRSEVLVAGDAAVVRDGDGEVPGTAAAAIDAGRHAAGNVLRALGGEEPARFRHLAAGRLAAVGRATYVGHAGPLELPPRLALAAARLAHARWLWPWRDARREAPAPAAALRARTA